MTIKNKGFLTLIFLLILFLRRHTSKPSIPKTYFIGIVINLHFLKVKNLLKLHFLERKFIKIYIFLSEFSFSTIPKILVYRHS